MIRMSVLYPGGDDATFDHDYYKTTHVPMACAAWNVGAEIDKGINGPHLAAVHFFFESVEQMQAAMASSGTAAVMADVANYTNIAPVIQVSEIV
ncbi:MAG: EthD family reductase [Ilumatobacteraceae bacterium]